MATSGTSVSSKTSHFVLALLAHKCAPNVFDLSSQLLNVSIRDQIVRGRVLAHSMEGLATALGRRLNLLVVGAGAAGASFALAAAHAKHEVVLLDKNSPFDTIAKASHRFVGPMMYEWPADGFDDQAFPQTLSSGQGRFADVNQALIGPSLSWTSKTPLAASVLASRLQTSFTNIASPLLANLKIFAPCPALVPEQSIIEFSKGRAGQLYSFLYLTLGFAFQPDYIILAAGMGLETLELNGTAIGYHFWNPASDPNHFGDNIGVFGGGDGALQDFLRAVFPDNHPLETLEKLKCGHPSEYDQVMKMGPLLNSFEQQLRTYITWQPPPEFTQYLDDRVFGVAESLATQTSIRDAIRPLFHSRPARSVHLVIREPGIGRAYMLNRFLVHLLDAMQQKEPGYPGSGAVSYQILKKWTAKSVKYFNASWKISIEGPTSTLRQDLVLDSAVIRFGVDSKTIPFQQVGISGKSPDKILLRGLGLPLSH